jgi:hypothetical protein
MRIQDGVADVGNRFARRGNATIESYASGSGGLATCLNFVPYADGLKNINRFAGFQCLHQKYKKTRPLEFQDIFLLDFATYC